MHAGAGSIGKALRFEAARPAAQGRSPETGFMIMYRLGMVSFTNTYPLVEGLREREDVALIPGTPRRLAEQLRAGGLDAAIAPVAEYLTHPGRYQILPGVCIGCNGEVQSVRLFSRRPPSEIQSVLGDPASLTSNLLTRVLLKEVHGIEPVMINGEDRDVFQRRLAEPDVEAAVVIGDLALRLHNGLQPHSFTHNLDLGQAWMDWTGLPFVYAAWLAPAGASAEPLASLLNEARDAGERALPKMAARCAETTGLPLDVCVKYYERNVTYHLDDAHLRGLARFEQAVQSLLETQPA